MKKILENQTYLEIYIKCKSSIALCDFSYAFVPRENIDDIIYNQAKKKAQKILDKVNKNMGLENQLAKTDDLLKDIIEELLDGNISRLWDEDE